MLWTERFLVTPLHSDHCNCFGQSKPRTWACLSLPRFEPSSIDNPFLTRWTSRNRTHDCRVAWKPLLPAEPLVCESKSFILFWAASAATIPNLGCNQLMRKIKRKIKPDGRFKNVRQPIFLSKDLPAVPLLHCFFASMPHTSSADKSRKLAVPNFL